MAAMTGSRLLLPIFSIGATWRRRYRILSYWRKRKWRGGWWASNQAGSFPLQTTGRLMCGCRVKGATLLFTDLDVHLAQYIGGTLVYGFQQVGDACGVISRQAVASFEQQAAWMSPNGFFLCNGGGVVPLPC